MIRSRLLRRHLTAVTIFAATLALAVPAGAQTVIDQWSTAVAPAPPALKAVTIAPKTTALLVLDFLKPNCGPRPRCVAVLPHVKTLLTAARAANMVIVYSGFPNSNPGRDTMPDVAPLGIEPTVVTIGDKFVDTPLDAILKAKGITTLLITGTSSSNAVLLTSIDAALHGYSVIVPLDAMASDDAYHDQYPVVILGTTLGVMEHVTLTRSDMVTFP
jgi:nicotinamidase-related amidase